MPREGMWVETPETAARAAIAAALEGGSDSPLVTATDALIAAFLQHPEWGDVVRLLSESEIQFVASKVKDGGAARLKQAR